MLHEIYFITSSYHFLYGKEEPSKICSLPCNVWLRSSVGDSARFLGIWRPGFKSSRSLDFAQASFLQLLKLQSNCTRIISSLQNRKLQIDKQSVQKIKRYIYTGGFLWNLQQDFVVRTSYLNITILKQDMPG